MIVVKWLVFEDNMCGCGGLDGRPEIFETKDEAEAYMREQIETYSFRGRSNYLLVLGEIMKED